MSNYRYVMWEMMFTYSPVTFLLTYIHKVPLDVEQGKLAEDNKKKKKKEDPSLSHQCRYECCSAPFSEKVSHAFSFQMNDYLTLYSYRRRINICTSKYTYIEGAYMDQ